jgi:hypothetical protein
MRLGCYVGGSSITHAGDQIKVTAGVWQRSLLESTGTKLVENFLGNLQESSLL